MHLRPELAEECEPLRSWRTVQQVKHHTRWQRRGISLVALRALRTGRARQPGLTSRTLRTGSAGETTVALRTLRTGSTGETRLAPRTLGTDRTDLTPDSVLDIVNHPVIHGSGNERIAKIGDCR